MKQVLIINITSKIISSPVSQEQLRTLNFVPGPREAGAGGKQRLGKRNVVKSMDGDETRTRIQLPPRQELRLLVRTLSASEY